MQSLYQALPLDDSRGDIRFLKFHKCNAPRSPENIECCLIRASADEIPKYTCLSYVWGDSTAREHITLDGIRVTITKSLYEALQAFQTEIQSSSYETIDHFLWADALCINQLDITEKSSQVQRMAQIYTDADCVWAWLGPLEWDTQLVIDECNMGGEMLCDLVSALAPGFEGRARSISSPGSFVELVPAVEDIAGIETFALIPEIASMGHPKCIYTLAHQLGWIESTNQSTRDFSLDECEILRTAWMRFCDRPFWKRIWILQELALGTNVYLVSGTASTKLEYLLTIWSLFMVTSFSPSFSREIWSGEALSYLGNLIDTGNMIGSILGIKLKRPRDIIQLIIFSRVLLATDARDRIYGLLGVSSDVRALGIVADYSMLFHEVCIDLARKLILNYGVQALCYARNHPRDIDVPSWVTFYSVLKHPSYSLREIHALRNRDWDFAFSSGETSQNFDEQSFISPLLLRVQGIFVDTVQTAIPTKHPSFEFRVSMPVKDLDFMRKVIEAINSLAAKKDQKYDSNDENYAPIWWLPILHRSPNAAPAPTREMYQAETDKIYRSYMALNQAYVPTETHHSSEISETELYRDLMYQATADCVFFNTTDHGFLGASSQFVENGDKICLFYGTETAHVLRPIGKGNQFQLLGEAYVLGIMHGEFLTGRPPVEEFILE
jgi:hypothetical protein